MEEEALAKVFADRLEKESNPTAILVSFYCALFELPFDKKLIGPFSRLIKLYGRNIAFHAIMDVYNYEDADLEHVMRILTFFCKKRLDAELKIISPNDLSKEIDLMNKKVDSIRKLRLEAKDPFNE